MLTFFRECAKGEGLKAAITLTSNRPGEKCFPLLRYNMVRIRFPRAQRMWKGVLFVCLFLLVSADEKDIKKPQYKTPPTFEGDSHVFFTESFSSPEGFAKR